jgi:hypothetical protein
MENSRGLGRNDGSSALDVDAVGVDERPTKLSGRGRALPERIALIMMDD